MKSSRHIAFCPLMNSGCAERLVDRFEFSCGATLVRGMPKEVWASLPRLNQATEISESERMTWLHAGGWIWLVSNEVPGPIEGNRNFGAICSALAAKVASLTWFIDLAGGGENNFWGSSGTLHCAGVYVASEDMPLWLTQRSPYVYSTPQEEYREAPWSQSVLEHANAIEQSLAQRTPKGIHPRIALANNLRHAMCAWNAHRQRMRLQLCVTALETLLIAPSEKKSYVWSPTPKERLRQICPSQHLLTDDFFVMLKECRDNATHRGGLAKDGTFATFRVAEMHVEVALREALCWALMKSATIDSHFEDDKWPDEIPSLDW